MCKRGRGRIFGGSKGGGGRMGVDFLPSSRLTLLLISLASMIFLSKVLVR